MPPPPDLPDLHADCDACAALCCVALAFDRGPRFAIDKPAGTPCPNLDGHRCSIHDSLDTSGFSGCVAYDCGGAGQRVLEAYDGRSWRDNPTLLSAQIETFRHMRTIHDAIGLLCSAERLGLAAEDEARRQSLLAALCPPEMSPALAEDLATGPALASTRAFLKSLARHLSPPR